MSFETDPKLPILNVFYCFFLRALVRRIGRISTHLVPVLRNLRKTELAAEVDQVENVLLEARATEADRSLEEFRADARVDADRVRNL